MPQGLTLFEPDLPEGFRYQQNFLSPAEESALLAEIELIEFSTFEMRGVVARRRVAFFGHTYDTEQAPPIPDFLLPLRDKVAEWTGVSGADFAMALINKYEQGAPIGWHRDAPQYGIVAGISLLSLCRMKLRPYVPPSKVTSSAPPRRTSHEITLEPRSAYLIAGAARTQYEHSIPAVASLRYSITFRTLRARGRAREPAAV